MPVKSSYRSTFAAAATSRKTPALYLLPAIAAPGHLLFPLDYSCGGSACGGGRLVRGKLVGEGKLVRECRASAFRRRDWYRQGGFWVLAIKAGSRSYHHGGCNQRWVPSRRVRGLAIKAGAAEVDSGSRCQGGCGFLKQAKGASTSLRVQILFMAGRAVTGVRGLDPEPHGLPL